MALEVCSRVLHTDTNPLRRQSRLHLPRSSHVARLHLGFGDEPEFYFPPSGGDPFISRSISVSKQFLREYAGTMSSIARYTRLASVDSSYVVAIKTRRRGTMQAREKMDGERYHQTTAGVDAEV